MRNSRRSKRSGKGNGRLVLQIIAAIMGLLIVVGGIGYIAYRQIKSHTDYKVASDEQMIARDALSDEHPTIPSFFTKPLVKKLYQGEGFKVTFVVKHDPNNGYKDSEEVFEIQPWEKYQETFVRVRRNQVDEQIKKFPEFVERFNEDRPRTIQLYLCVDDTEGISTGLKKQVTEEVKSWDIAAKLAKGHTVEVIAWPLSDTEFTHNQKVVLKPDTDDVETKLKPLYTFLFGEKPGDVQATATSDIAGGIKRIASVAAEHPDRQFLFFGDSLQNHNGVHFYGAEGMKMLEEKNWPSLDKTLFDDKLPALKDAKIDWFPPQVAASESALVRKSLTYWEHVFAKAGAKAKIH